MIFLRRVPAGVAFGTKEQGEGVLALSEARDFCAALREAADGLKAQGVPRRWAWHVGGCHGVSVYLRIGDQKGLRAQRTDLASLQIVFDTEEDDSDRVEVDCDIPSCEALLSALESVSAA